MSVKEQVLHQLDSLGEADLLQLAKYVEFLKSRPRRQACSKGSGEVAALYAEFAEEDGHLAEHGMPEYAEGLATEDSR